MNEPTPKASAGPRPQDPPVYDHSVRAVELLPDTVTATRSWEQTTLLRRQIHGLGGVEAARGNDEHVLVLNTHDWDHTDQRRGGRRVEGPTAAGSINFLPAHESFTWTWDERQRYESFHVCLRPELIYQVAEESGALNPARVRLRHVFNLRDERLQHGLQMLHRELAALASGRGGFGSSLYVDSLSQAVALHLIRHHATEAPRDTTEPGRLSRPEFKAVHEFIDSHLDHDLTLSELARAVGLSVSHFLRQFKRTTGQTPHSYVMACRVERAKAMLSDKALGEQGIAPIAAACGFSDQAHLGRHFKRVVGMTPAAYRRSLK